MCDLWAVMHGVVQCAEVAEIVGCGSVEHSDCEVRSRGLGTLGNLKVYQMNGRMVFNSLILSRRKGVLYLLD